MNALHDAYFGIHFPACFYQFNDFVADLQSDHNIDINSSALQIQLADAFDVFRPDFKPEQFNPASNSRYPNDPPEFFTLIHGASDGLHWGYYLEDPDQPEYFVVSYAHSDPLRFSIDGLNLFETTRKILEKSYEDQKDYLEIYGDEEYKKELEELDRIRTVLKNYDTQNRGEIGKAYLETYRYQRKAILPTRDGLGIELDHTLYRPIRDADLFLIPGFTPTQEQVAQGVDEALDLLKKGFPGTALKLGKDLWCYQQYQTESFQLLEKAYRALGRETALKFLAMAKRLNSGK